MENDTCRQAFECFISGPPYELSVERYPNDPRKFAWPGSYCRLEVQTAWEAWKQATEVANACHDGCKITRVVKTLSDNAFLELPITFDFDEVNADGWRKRTTRTGTVAELLAIWNIDDHSETSEMAQVLRHLRRVVHDRWELHPVDWPTEPGWWWLDLPREGDPFTVFFNGHTIFIDGIPAYRSEFTPGEVRFLPAHVPTFQPREVT